MSNQFEDRMLQFRRLRRDFMMAAIEQGKEIIIDLELNDPELADQLHRAIPNQGRAAFWLTSDADPHTRMTPLNQLARGQRDQVEDRLKNYTSQLSTMQPVRA